MKLLLTGASGFLGRNFLELVPKDIQITGIYNKSKDIIDFAKKRKLSNVSLYQCDLSDETQVRKLFKTTGKQFDCCLHLAGNVNVPLSNDDPFYDLKQTAGSVINILNNANIDRFVFLSTAGVYDGNKGKVSAKTSLNPINPYCISKLAAEQYVQFFHNKGFIKEFVIVRFSGAFGKYSEGKFMTKLVRSLLNDSKTIEIYGDGTNMINVMYVEDTVNALLSALKAKEKNIICNLGLENMTITQTVQRAAKALNKKIRIEYIPKDERQKYITFSYDSDFNKIFRCKPKYAFEQGIKAFAKDLQ